MSTGPEEGYWLGFDLGGTKMLSVLFDRKMSIVAKRRRKTKGNSGPEAGVARIIETIERNLIEANISSDQLLGIGIGCPGPVNPKKRRILLAPNLGWKDVDIGEMLESHFHCPVEVLNDVDAGVYGEYRFGAGVGANCVVGIFPGTGVGGGCVYNGMILQGASITCMELGMTRLSSHTNASGGGLVGTLEAEASRLAIAAEVAKAAYRGEAPLVFKQAGTDISKIRSSTLAEAIKHDPVVKSIVEQAANTLGVATANLIHLLAPEKIILGGGLVEAMQEMFIEIVAKTARRNVLGPFRDSFEVVPAMLGDDAGAYGSAAWIEHQVKNLT